MAGQPSSDTNNKLALICTMILFYSFPVGLGFLCDEDCEAAETPETSESYVYSHFE